MTLDAVDFDTDKGPLYIRNYDRYFQPLQDKPVHLLELGVHRGGSLKLWRTYFPLGLIVGLDLNPPLELGDRIHVFQGSQSDPHSFARIRETTGIDRFDIIIDDASHYGELSRLSFELLFRSCLKPCGLYVIEDWGTGYNPEWPDGRSYTAARTEDGAQTFVSHNAGMVGFVKSLVDCVGRRDVAASGSEALGTLAEVASVEFLPGQVFLRKPL